MEQLKEAEQVFREGLSIVDDREKKAWFALFLAQIIGRDKARHKEMLPLFAKAIEFDPNFDEAHYNLGVALANEGDYRGALRTSGAFGGNRSQLRGRLCATW